MTDHRQAYLTGAVHRYSALFSFPSYHVLLMLFVFLSLIGSIAAFIIVSPTLPGLTNGVFFSVQVLIVPTLVVDVLTWKTLLAENSIFNLKRLMALSTFAALLCIVAMNLGAVCQALSGNPLLLSRASVFGACITFAMRYLVYTSTTSLKSWKLALAMTLQPMLILLSTAWFWRIWSPSLFLSIGASCTLLLLATQLFIFLVNKRGELSVGIGSLALFQGFLANWLEDLTYPLEGYFETLGSNTDVHVELLAFSGADTVNAILAVTDIHPGPFRNLGSSNLPYAIQAALEDAYPVIAAVPHGASGHERDLASQAHCQRVVRDVLGLAQFTDFAPSATKLVRVASTLAQASCQIMGEVAFVTLTCSPASMEDVPYDVGLRIESEALRLGAAKVVVIDAHNSIGPTKDVPVLSEEELKALEDVALKAVEEPLSEPAEPFEIGIDKLVPREFSVAQGMGLGGIVALVLVVGGQRVAYITIDGNNMVKGLRDAIVRALDGVVDDCEVMTTDTHIVNGIQTIERGYRPVGEAVNRETLMAYIKMTVINALNKIQKGEVAFVEGKIRGVRIIGEEKLKDLSLLVDSTYRYVVHLLPMIYLPATLLAVLPLILT
jgi:putative membrane protein